jgi:hypothetical protein
MHASVRIEVRDSGLAGPNDETYNVVSSEWHNGHLELRLHHSEPVRDPDEVILYLNVPAIHEILRGTLGLAAAAAQQLSVDQQNHASQWADLLFSEQPVLPRPEVS